MVHSVRAVFKALRTRPRHTARAYEMGAVVFSVPISALAGTPHPRLRGSARLPPRAPGRACWWSGFPVLCATLGPVDREANETHTVQPSGSLYSSRERRHSANSQVLEPLAPCCPPPARTIVYLCAKLIYLVCCVSLYTGLPASCGQGLCLDHCCIPIAQHRAWHRAGAR